MDVKKKIKMSFYNWIQENHGKNENINPTKFGGEKYYVQYNLWIWIQSNYILIEFKNFSSIQIACNVIQYFHSNGT